MRTKILFSKMLSIAFLSLVPIISIVLLFNFFSEECPCNSESIALIDKCIKLDSFSDQAFIYAETFGAAGHAGYNGSIFHVLNSETGEEEKIELEGVGLKKAMECLGIKSMIQIDKGYFANPSYGCYEEIKTGVNTIGTIKITISDITLQTYSDPRSRRFLAYIFEC